MAQGPTSAAGFATDGARGPSRPQLRHMGAICLVVVALVGGCGPAVPSGSRMVAFDDEGLRLTLPPGWEEIRSSELGSDVGRTLFYLSNQTLRQDCAGDGCGPPLDALLDGGMLVWWSSARCAGVGCELPGGERLLISGREAARGSDTGVCDAMGATEEKVYAVSVTPQRLDWIVICARSPADRQRAELASILDGIQWRTP
jgi:hypothetical protein